MEVLRDDFNKPVRVGDVVETSRSIMYKVVMFGEKPKLKNSEGLILDLDYLENFKAFWRAE